VADMIIDAHVHVMSCRTWSDLGDKIVTAEDLIGFRTRHPETFLAANNEPPTDNTDRLLADMDRHGVRYAMVQARPGPVGFEDVARVVRAHPDRLFGLFSFAKDQQISGVYLDDPTPVREQAVAEIDRLVTELGFLGMGETFMRTLTAEIHPERIARDLEPIMRKLAQHRIPIQIMTAWTQFRGGLWLGDPVWVDELAGRHPDVTIILTKMGRSIQTYFDHALAVALRNENVYFDTVGTSPEHLRIAVSALGARRIMFGTDWSATWSWVRKPADLYTTRLGVIDRAGLSDEDREQVLWKTAVQVFKLPIDIEPGERLAAG
jgi:predicted TIM-barrel fold metal-dependent hydrolase